MDNEYKLFKNNFLFYIKNLDYLIYRRKHLILYIIIGILSIYFELLIRNFLVSFNISIIIASILSLLFGITFAFILNFFINFNVPNYLFYRSLIYFFIIFIFSYLFQITLKNYINYEYGSYENSRYIFSGLFFLIGYFFHVRFTFKDKRIVGVAIYSTVSENINNIFKKIGFYPDFIHIDIIDESFNPNSEIVEMSKINTITEFWPNHSVDLHIMSTTPLKYLNKNIKNLNVIYFHKEINDNLNEVYEKILDMGAKPGIVLHSKNIYSDLNEIIQKFNNILILSIENPGTSGQNFIKQSYELIKRINTNESRKKIILCVDGGVNIKNLNSFDCEKIVSASDILKSDNPKRKIMSLQTLARYENKKTKN